MIIVEKLGTRKCIFSRCSRQSVVRLDQVAPSLAHARVETACTQQGFGIELLVAVASGRLFVIITQHERRSGIQEVGYGRLSKGNMTIWDELRV
jgi:hypothetical protein